MIDFVDEKVIGLKNHSNSVSLYIIQNGCNSFAGLICSSSVTQLINGKQSKRIHK